MPVFAARTTPLIVHFNKRRLHALETPSTNVANAMKNQTFAKRMGFALQGLVAAFRLESSFRLQCLATVTIITVLAVIRPPMIWWALLLLNCGVVLAAELFNTALEHLIDHLHPSLHPIIKIAKDCAAGAVFVLSLTAVCVFVTFLIEMVTV